MNFRMSNRNRMLALSTAALTGITLVAWQQQPLADPSTGNYADTIPNRSKKIRPDKDQDKYPGKDKEKDLEKELDKKSDKDFEKDLEKKLEKNFDKDFEKELKLNLDQVLEKELKLNLNKDFEKELELKFKKDFEENFEKNFGKDLEKEMKTLEKSMKKLEKISSENFKDLDAQIRLKLEDIELGKISTDVDLALNDAGLHRLQDLKIKLDNIDLSDLKISLEQSMKDLELNLDKAGKQLEKATEDMKDMNLNFSESMRLSLKGMEKARSVMERFQDMIDEMEEQKLLNPSTDYTVELRDDVLYINDKKQSEAVTTKYKKYFSDGNTRIRKKDGNISVSKNKRISD